MQSFKPLLPMGEKTVLEHTVELFKQAGICDIRVVIGHRANEIAAFANATGAQVIENPYYESGMFSSIKAGIKNLKNTQEAFFLLPVDVPLVRCQSVLELLNTWQNSEKKIFYPTFMNRRGHPPLISTEFAQKITEYKGGTGLRSFLKQHEVYATDVPVIDEHILFDIDTPDDYHKMLDMYKHYDIPTTCECLEILTRRFAVGKGILDHCLAVAQVAGYLTQILNSSGCSIEPELVNASSLLHDMLKSEPDHAQAAARVIEKMGYPRVADIVACHMDIIVEDDVSFHAAEVVYLADKLIYEGRLVPCHDRFKYKRAEYDGDINAIKAINVRYETLIKVKKRFENQTGRSLDKVLSDMTLVLDESIVYDFSY